MELSGSRAVNESAARCVHDDMLARVAGVGEDERGLPCVIARVGSSGCIVETLQRSGGDGPYINLSQTASK